MVMFWKVIFRSFLLFFFIIHQCVGPPTKQKAPDSDVNHDNSSTISDDLGLEYGRYLKEVVQTLEADPEFRKKLESAAEVDFRTGKVAAELEYVNHNVRTKLDELKRVELQRLKQLVKESDRLEKKQKNQYDIVGHLDHSNEHTFEVADLHRLITKVRLDLEEADKRRKEEFKEYEMQKKFEQEQKMKVMDEEHKKKYLEELDVQKKKHQQHEPLHHPGSKAQLEEVWEKEDHMENQKFDPKAFFHLHDLDGNGYWDEEEVKALFLKEIQKLYDAGAPEDDMVDKQEEMERMREHVFSEADTNRDRLISYAEFMMETKKQEFERDDGWESIDQKPQFTQQEYEDFEKRRQEEIQRLIDQGHLQPYAPGMMPPPQYAPHPAQFQNHPGQGGYVQPPHPGANLNQIPQYQYGGQVGQHPNQVHPQQQQYQPVHPGQVPPEYHAGVPQPNLHHPNQIPQQPQQYQNQIPHSNTQYKQQVAPNPNEISNQIPQNGPPHDQLKHQQVNQQQQPHSPQQVNQMPPKQDLPQQPQYQQQPQHQQQPQVQQQYQQQPQHQQQPQYQQQQPQHQQQPQVQYQQQPQQPQQPQYQQQQSNDIPQKQYESKYEPHGNRIGSNEKNSQDGVPK